MPQVEAAYDRRDVALIVTAHRHGQRASEIADRECAAREAVPC